MALSKRSNLNPADFAIQNAKSFVIMTDWEPDDAIFVVGFLRMVGKLFPENTPPIAFVSGGGKAVIQQARAQKYVALCQADGFFPKDAPVEFIRGSNSTQDYNRQGADVLTEEEIAAVTKDGTDQKPETDKLQAFLEKHPESMVFGLKKPEEIVGNDPILNLLSKAILVFYAGGFNISVANKEDLKRFFDAFAATAFVQNFLMLQDGKKFPKGDGTPRDVTKTNTPEFARLLAGSESASARAILENIRLWNEKIIYDFASKARDSDASCLSPVNQVNHQAGCVMLKGVVPTDRKSFNMAESLLTIKAAVKLLDPNAKLANAKSDKDTLGFRVKVLENIVDDPLVQTVIADPLALFAVLHPEEISTCVRGHSVTQGFIDVQEDAKGSSLNMGPIKGSAGTKLSGGERIAKVDHFLCETVLGKTLAPVVSLSTHKESQFSQSSSVVSGIPVDQSHQKDQVQTPSL